MNYDIFSIQLRNAYYESDCRFSVDECFTVFKEFFERYKEKTGHEHPPLRTPKLIQLLNIIDGEGLFDADTYTTLIEGYFSTHFKNCDYNICHFFGGKVRELRYYELLL